MQVLADHFGVNLATISRTECGIRVNYNFAQQYRTWLAQQPTQIAA